MRGAEHSILSRRGGSFDTVATYLLMVAVFLVVALCTTDYTELQPRSSHLHSRRREDLKSYTVEDTWWPNSDYHTVTPVTIRKYSVSRISNVNSTTVSPSQLPYSSIIIHITRDGLEGQPSDLVSASSVLLSFN